MSENMLRDWSLFYRFQVDLNRRFGPIWRIPVRQRHTDLITGRLEQGLSILEIGASDRNILKKINLAELNLDYRSLDTDRSLPHDYHSIEDVDRTFRMIWMFEVVEHVALADAFTLMGQLFEILEPGGVLILSTPNGHHPHRFREPHHCTAFKFDSLAALVESSGFKVEALFRIHNAPLFQKVAHRFLLNWLHRFLDIDFAKTLGLVARKEPEPA